MILYKKEMMGYTFVYIYIVVGWLEKETLFIQKVRNKDII
jgi:hypothetical protein